MNGGYGYETKKKNAVQDNYTVAVPMEKGEMLCVSATGENENILRRRQLRTIERDQRRVYIRNRDITQLGHAKVVLE